MNHTWIGRLWLAAFVFAASNVASVSDASPFEHFYCNETGYTAQSFELRQWDTNFYVKGRRNEPGGLLNGRFDLMLPVDACKLDTEHVGTFHCVTDAGGMVVSDYEKFHYDRVEITVKYAVAQNTYKPFQDEWPVWHRRITEFKFEGGDFKKAESYRFGFNVNFYNSPSTSFRETCVIDGKVIEK